MPDVLSRLLGSLEVTEFFGETWGEKPRVIRDSSYGFPLSVEDFDKIINFSNLTYPQIQCFDSRGEIDPIRYTRRDGSGPDRLSIEAVRLTELTRSATTIRLSNISELSSALWTSRKQLEAAFGCRVHINAYYSTGPSDGMLAHYDPHHIFAVQLYGVKHWRLGDVIINEPTPEFLPQPTEDPAFTDTVDLNPGDILYLPPGAWHRASTKSQSLHLTVGLHPPSWEGWLIQEISRISKKHPIFRAALPMLASDENECQYEATKDDARAILKLFIDDLPEVSAVPGSQAEQGLSKALPFRSGCSDSPRAPKIESNTQFLLDDIWQRATQPHSLYLRGSFADSKSTYAPWDIDIYFVVHDGNKDDLNGVDVVRELQAKHSSMPRIDLTVLERASLFDGSESLLRRLLLVNEGRCVKGEDIRESVPIPPLNDEVAREVRREMKRFIEKILVSFSWGDKDLQGFSTDDFDLYTKSIAKSLLRAGTWLGISRDRIFSRNIDHCADQLKFSSVSHADVEFLMRRLRGESMQLTQFLSAAERIYSEIYE